MIGETLLGEVLDHVSRNGGLADEALAVSLRERFRDVHFSVCSDDDMPPRVPFAAENALCRLYFVQSGEHCLSLTTDADAATGLAVARIDPDES